MIKNMGNADRLIRTFLAVVVAWLYFTHHLTGTFGVVMLVIAVVFVVTSFISWCPVYQPFGFSTRSKGTSS